MVVGMTPGIARLLWNIYDTAKGTAAGVREKDTIGTMV